MGCSKTENGGCAKRIAGFCNSGGNLLDFRYSSLTKNIHPVGQGGVVNAVPVLVAGVNSVDADDSDDKTSSS